MSKLSPEERAEQIFSIRQRQIADAPKAMADYKAAEQRLRDRTRELKDLRLAAESKKLKPALQSYLKGT